MKPRSVRSRLERLEEAAARGEGFRFRHTDGTATIVDLGTVLAVLTGSDAHATTLAGIVSTPEKAGLAGSLVAYAEAVREGI